MLEPGDRARIELSPLGELGLGPSSFAAKVSQQPGKSRIHPADAIVDRITTNAHATVLDCDDSMRKHFTHLE